MYNICIIYLYAFLHVYIYVHKQIILIFYYDYVKIYSEYLPYYWIYKSTHIYEVSTLI